MHVREVCVYAQLKNNNVVYPCKNNVAYEKSLTRGDNTEHQDNYK